MSDNSPKSPVESKPPAEGDFERDVITGPGDERDVVTGQVDASKTEAAKESDPSKTEVEPAKIVVVVKETALVQLRARRARRAMVLKGTALVVVGGGIVELLHRLGVL